MELFLAWMVLAGLAAFLAGARGRRGWAWFLLALALSPVVALIAVLALDRVRPPPPPSRRTEYRGYVIREEHGTVTAMGQEFGGVASAKAAIDRTLRLAAGA